MTKTAKATRKLLVASFSIFVVIGSIVLISGWYYIFVISNNVNKINSEIENLSEEANALSNLAIQYRYISDQKDIVLEALPNNKEVSGFLATIEQVAKKNNLKISEDIIGETQTKKKITDVQLRQTVSVSGYYKLRNEYSLRSGKYEDILNFITDINDLRRVANIESIRLVATDTQAQEGGSTLSARIVINVYIKK